MKTERKQLKIINFNTGLMPVIWVEKEEDFKKYCNKNGVVLKCQNIYYSVLGRSSNVILKYVESKGVLKCSP